VKLRQQQRHMSLKNQILTRKHQNYQILQRKMQDLGHDVAQII